MKHLAASSFANWNGIDCDVSLMIMDQRLIRRPSFLVTVYWMFTLRIGKAWLRIPQYSKRLFAASANSDSISIDGHTIAYTVIGNGPHNVLFLPGALGSYKTDFQPQLDEFDRNQFTLIAWDPPGYGRSRPPDRDFSGHFLRRDADMAHKLMKELGKSQYSLVGWSDGGITALILAGTYSKFVKRLVVLAGNAYVTAKDIELGESIADLSKWSDRMRAPFLAMYGEEYFREMWTGWLKSYKKFYTDAPDGDICKKEVQNIQCETLIVYGSQDALVPEEHCHYLHKQIAGSELVIWPNGKHNLHLKYAKDFNKMVQTFLLKPEKNQSKL